MKSIEQIHEAFQNFGPAIAFQKLVIVDSRDVSKLCYSTIYAILSLNFSLLMLPFRYIFFSIDSAYLLFPAAILKATGSSLITNKNKMTWSKANTDGVECSTRHL